MSNIFSLREIKSHNNIDDCWLIANNNVYDATSFLKEHPAHSKRVLKYAGTDVTNDFNFHTKNQKDEWKKYFIGYVDNYNHKIQCCIIF
jgi:cytochrome b involved in lipid metabolism